ncbi:MAG: hypothetical protein AAFO29_21040, partial [Actinomycetota bacterium]
MNPTNRALARFLVIGLPLLALGGCLAVAILPDDDDPVDLGSPLPRSEYEFSEQIQHLVDAGLLVELDGPRPRGQQDERLRVGRNPTGPDLDLAIPLGGRRVL